MKKTITSIFLFSTILCFAQETRFFMPTEIKQAYEKGTRSYNGKPGDKHWQNTVKYNIEATIIPEKRLIQGKENVIYFNNSPNKLHKLVIRLYADVYKKGNPRKGTLPKNDINEGVIIKVFSINYKNGSQSTSTSSRGTNMTIELPTPLLPGDSITFECSWEQIIPRTNFRTGTIDSTTFSIAYWYPQISVYDDIFGWDETNYMLLTEFYNNLADFDVKITVPENFIVGATGKLENAKQVLSNKIYKRFEQAKTSSEVIQIITQNDIENGINASENTWHYTAKNVTDFAFAISDHYLWDAATQTTHDKNILINSFYPIDTTTDYSKQIPIIQQSIQYFSTSIPNTPFPFDAFTAFFYKGNGMGMEYPMMAHIGTTDRDVLIHEVFHSYFPMYVRTNERKWAWMDEGWATFTTSLIANKYFDKKQELNLIFQELKPIKAIGTNMSIPLIASSESLIFKNYYQVVYAQAGMVNAIIYEQLGDTLFSECYTEYIKRWTMKSPTPYDYFYTFENVSGQDLSWIWKPWFFTFCTEDIAIESFTKGTLTLKNIGGKPMPIFIELNYENGGIKNIHKKANNWKDGNTTTIKIPNAELIKNISVNKKIADANLFDNFHPSIESLYENIETSSKLFGNYWSDKISKKIEITKKENIIYFTIPNHVNIILYPKNKETLHSLDESIKIRLSSESTVDIDWKGFQYSAKKQK